MEASRVSRRRRGILTSAQELSRRQKGAERSMVAQSKRKAESILATSVPEEGVALSKGDSRAVVEEPESDGGVFAATSRGAGQNAKTTFLVSHMLRRGEFALSGHQARVRLFVHDEFRSDLRLHRRGTTSGRPRLGKSTHQRNSRSKRQHMLFKTQKSSCSLKALVLQWLVGPPYVAGCCWPRNHSVEGPRRIREEVRHLVAEDKSDLQGSSTILVDKRTYASIVCESCRSTRPIREVSLGLIFALRAGLVRKLRAWGLQSEHVASHEAWLAAPPVFSFSLSLALHVSLHQRSASGTNAERASTTVAPDCVANSHPLQARGSPGNEIRA